MCESVHPISSKNPAAQPNASPIQKWFGANAGVTIVFRPSKTASTDPGGMASAHNHRDLPTPRTRDTRPAARPALESTKASGRLTRSAHKHRWKHQKSGQLRC